MPCFGEKCLNNTSKKIISYVPLSFTWQRGDSTLTRTITPALEQVVDRGDIKEVGLIGISPQYRYRRARLFEGLRLLDRTDASEIAVMPIPEAGLGLAINDRLRRAAAPRP